MPTHANRSGTRRRAAKTLSHRLLPMPDRLGRRDVTEQGRAFDVAQRMEAIIESSDDAIIALTL